MADALKWQGGGVDASTLATKAELNKKQDALTPGDNVTITVDPITGQNVITCTGGLTEEKLGEILETYGQEITAEEVSALFVSGGGG